MTSINRDRVFRSQILLANACQNFLFQLRQSVFGHARNSQCREILQSLSSGKSLLFKTTISFGSLVAPLKSAGFGELRSAMCSRKSASCNDFCVRSIPARSRSLSEARKPAVSSNRIGTPSRLTVSSIISRVVPCCVADDHAIIAKQAIEQTRFAGVCRTVNHDAHTFAQHTTLVGGREQHGDFISNRIQSAAERFVFVGFNAFLRKIDIDALMCAAARSIHRESSYLIAGTRLRVVRWPNAAPDRFQDPDQIDHRFSLGEIHFPIEKRALGEFAWTRACGACTQTCFKNFRGNEGAAVTTDT